MPSDADRLVAESLADALREMDMGEVFVKYHGDHEVLCADGSRRPLGHSDFWIVAYTPPGEVAVHFIGPDLDALAEAIMECLGGAEA
jgi:hypothetical protein